jgi:hypothetical protein
MNRRSIETSKRLGLMAGLARTGVKEKMELLTERERARTMELTREEEELCTSS